MQIGFDISPLYVPQSGVGTYTANLWQHLCSQDSHNILPLAPCLPNITSLSIYGSESLNGFLGLPHRNPNGHHDSFPTSYNGISLNGWSINKTFWLQAVLPWQVARMGVDICHFTNHVGSLWTHCPTVVTIYDMSLWLFPKYHHYRRLLTMRPLIPLAARRAAAIITISYSAKKDIVKILGIPAHKIHVIYGAAAPCFKPLTPGPALDSICQKYRLPERFLLFVGTIEPRKNLVRLLEAFAQLRHSDAKFRDYVLVVVGQRGWKDEAVFATVERLGLSQAVIFLGHVPTNALVALYNMADALAFPSLYEGFGLPVVEAMACGTPVITSRNSALGEIARDAAELVEPTDSRSIFEGLRRVLTNSARQEELRTQGFVRAAQFAWSTTATQTRQLYTQIVSN